MHAALRGLEFLHLVRMDVAAALDAARFVLPRIESLEKSTKADHVGVKSDGRCGHWQASI